MAAISTAIIGGALLGLGVNEVKKGKKRDRDRAVNAQNEEARKQEMEIEKQQEKEKKDRRDAAAIEFSKKNARKSRSSDTLLTGASGVTKAGATANKTILGS